MSPLVLLPCLAFVITVLLYALARRVFPALNLLDFPERYGLQRARLPYPTGVMAVLAFLLLYLTFFEFSLQSLGVTIGVLIIGGMCVIDDVRPLPSVLRLLLQFSAAIIIFATGTRIYTLTNPLEPVLGWDLIKLDTIDIVAGALGPLPLVSGIFTLFWLGITMNALNWFDGVQGQVSLLSVIGFVVIGFLSLSDRVGQPELALLSFVLAGIAAASVLFTLPPPRMILGDTGAMFFGLMLGTLTIYAGGKVATAFLVLGVPLIDLFIVMGRRILNKRSPLKGSMHGEHLHHRLIARGWSDWQIMLLTAALGSSFGVAALFLSTTQKFAAALLLFVIMIGLSLLPIKKELQS